MENSSYKIRFDSISMEFPGVLAVDDVSFDVQPGVVHVMMGENGAGKSTLMKILNGVYQPSKGKVFISGEERHFSSAMDAKKHGIGMIYQELSYIPEMTIERYLMLGNEPRKGFVIDWKAVSSESKRILEEENLSYDPKMKLKDLSVSDIQLLEIIKCTRSENTDILIMDEPTSALTEEEVERLFEKIRKLKEQGVTILYISHKMNEIFRIADYITVMRDGKEIKTGPAAEFDEKLIVALMVGREINNIYPKETVPIGEVALEVEHLYSKFSRLEDISFNVREGEIVGLGGLMGAGRTETVRAIFGMDPYDSGVIRVKGKEVTIKSVPDAIKHGICMATEDRRRLGLVPVREIKDNISLSSHNRISKYSLINKAREAELTQEYFDKMGVRAPGIHYLAGTLSGGNQQKVVLAKCLMTEAKILILDEPTRGIDVGAKREIYKLMVELARNGIAIVMISSELPEFISMCDRAYVMSGGKIVGELDKEHLTQENVVRLAAGGKE